MNLLGVQLEPSFVVTMIALGIVALTQTRWWRSRR